MSFIKSTTVALVRFLFFFYYAGILKSRFKINKYITLPAQDIQEGRVVEQVNSQGEGCPVVDVVNQPEPVVADHPHGICHCDLNREPESTIESAAYNTLNEIRCFAKDEVRGRGWGGFLLLCAGTSISFPYGDNLTYFILFICSRKLKKLNMR